MIKAIGLFLMLSLIAGSGFAATEDEISPYYSYTQLVTAGLSIDSSGVAECDGGITVYDLDSHISLSVRLQRKEGSTWILVKKWSDSCTGYRSISINKTYTVSEGTYRVVASGVITASDGQVEAVSCTTSSRTYP